MVDVASQRISRVEIIGTGLLANIQSTIAWVVLGWNYWMNQFLFELLALSCWLPPWLERKPLWISYTVPASSPHPCLRFPCKHISPHSFLPPCSFWPNNCVHPSPISKGWRQNDSQGRETCNRVPSACFLSYLADFGKSVLLWECLGKTQLIVFLQEF